MILALSQVRRKNQHEKLNKLDLKCLYVKQSSISEWMILDDLFTRINSKLLYVPMYNLLLSKFD